MKRVETTPNRAGYPESIRDAIIDFDNWEQIQEISKKFKIEPETFHKKEGWQLWVRDYCRNVTPYNLYRHYTAQDDYITYKSKDYPYSSVFFSNEVMIKLINDVTFEEAVVIVENWKKIWDAIDELDDEQFVLVDSDDDFQVMNDEAVSYTEDTNMYSIGFVSADRELLDDIENYVSGKAEIPEEIQL